MSRHPEDLSPLRPILNLKGDRPVVGPMTLHAALDRPARASIVLAGRIEPPDAGAPASIEVAGLSFPSLEVQHPDIPLDERPGGSLELVDPVARARPYGLEIFSGSEGAAFAEALSARIEDAWGPAELAGLKDPAIVVEGLTLEQLLSDVCARRGWHWRRGEKGLQVGPLDQGGAVSVEGVEPRKTDGAIRIRLTSEPWPMPGAHVRTRWGEGVVLEATITYDPAAGLRCEIAVGTPPTPARFRPRGLLRLDAVIRSLTPFMVAVRDEEGRELTTHARLMKRISDEQEWDESLPVKPGDHVLAEVITGGVSTEAPRAYLWTEADPATEYECRARSRKDRVAGAWDQQAGSARTTADVIQAYVVKEFRIDRKR